MFPHLQLSDPRERWAVGLADALLSPIAGLRRLRTTPAAAAEAASILLLRLERIGDLLMTLDAIQAVRARAPRARIELVVGSWNEPLARLIPGIDRVDTLDAPWLARGAASASLSRSRVMVGSWRKRRFDLAINFEGDIRSNGLMWLSGAARRVGFDMGGGGPLLTTRVRYDLSRHVADNSMRLVQAALGGPSAASSPAVGPRSRLSLPDSARARAAALLPRAASPAPLVGVHASGGREIKQWDPARFAEVAAGLARSHGAQVVLTGSAADRAVVDRLKAAWPGGTGPVDLAGDLDLVTLAAVLERLTVFVTGDTGPMHLAAAVGTPTVALFGPSDPARWGPRAGNAHIIRVELPCSPCNRIRRPPARCVGHVPDCLSAIAADRVREAVVSAIEARRQGGPGDGR